MDTVIIAREIAGKAEYGDGMMVIGTLWWEALERAIHNEHREFLPSHPDSEVMPCVHNCAYCRANDVNPAAESCPCDSGHPERCPDVGSENAEKSDADVVDEIGGF